MDEESEEILERMDTLVGGSGISFVGMITKQIIEAVTTLVLTMGVGAAAYGIVASVRRVVVFLSISAGGIYSGLTRTVPRHEKQSQNLIITFSYLLILFISLLIASVMFLFRSEIVSYTLLRAEDIRVIALAGVMLIGLMQVSVTGAVFKSFKQIKNLTITELISLPLFKLILVGAVLIFFDHTVTNVVIAVAISYVSAAVFGFILMYRRTSYSISNISLDYDPLVEHIIFIVPNSVSSLTVMLQLFSYPVFMAVLLEPVAAGAFGVSLVLSPFVRWPLRAVNNIFPPIATELYDDDMKDVLNQLYKRTSRLILTVSLPILCVFVLFYVEIITLFSTEYATFAIIVPLMALGQLIAGAHGSVGLLLSMTDNERKAMVLQTVITPFLLATTYLLTVNYGVIGLSVSHLIAFTVNNMLELSLLKYAEGLFPFTVSQFKSVGLALVLLIISFTLYFVIGFYISVIAFVLCSAVYYYVAFFYVFDSLDRKILSNYKP